MVISNYNLARAMYADRVLEIGCGPGLMSQMFATCLQKQGGVYVVTDLSDGMLDSAKKLINEGEFASFEGNVCKTLPDATQLDTTDLEAEIKNVGNFRKLVIFQKVNADKVPYPAESFDVISSSLTLRLSADIPGQVKQYFDLLKEGGHLAVSDFGRMKNSEHTSMFYDLMVKHAPEVAQQKKSGFPLSEIDKMRELMIETGFKQVKVFYQEIKSQAETAEEVFPYLSTGSYFVAKIWEQCSPEAQEKIRNDYYRLFEEKWGPETNDHAQMEYIVAICKK